MIISGVAVSLQADILLFFLYFICTFIYSEYGLATRGTWNKEPLLKSCRDLNCKPTKPHQPAGKFHFRNEKNLLSGFEHSRRLNIDTDT